MEPLAYRMRPTCLNEVIGQKHLIGKNKILRKCVENKHLFSMILYGPAGCGKTTLARVLANECGVHYRLFNAVTGNKKDLDQLFEESKYFPSLVVIIDEVHRLNKDKQDLLLPYVESGAITLIGATTSNPLFAINPAIRSRCHLLEVKSNSIDDVKEAMDHAIKSEKGLNNQISLDEDAALSIAVHVNGDIRYALNILEICAMSCENSKITLDTISQFTQIPNFAMDKSDDGHYDTVSAFQKSIRGSDVNASLHYLARLIEADNLDIILRRLAVIVYEDIGLANPSMGPRVMAAIESARLLGLPEARIPLAEIVIELALSPKSNSAEMAIDLALNELRTKNVGNVPKHLHNGSPDYLYPHSYKNDYVKQEYLPDNIKNSVYYIPKNNKNENTLKSIMDNLKKLN